MSNWSLAKPPQYNEPMGIEGIWHSSYEYGRGPKDEPQTSEHHIEFARVGDKWVGTSLPHQEGSDVVITLVQDGNEFAGQWRERTSPTGHYAGRTFSGLILLLLQQNSSELNGMWLGAGSSTGRVKTGTWMLKREDHKT